MKNLSHITNITSKIIKNIFLSIFFILITTCFGIIGYFINKNNDKSVYLESLLLDNNKIILNAFFAPDDDIKKILLSLISCEKSKIQTTIYTITQKDIANELIEAHKRGVKVECIVDRSYGGDKFSKIPKLANNNIAIWVYQTDEKNSSLMHNKFFIFHNNILDKKIVWTGSYNLTNRANNYNQENIIILDDNKICNKYNNQFEKIKSRSILISGTRENLNIENINNKNKSKNNIIDVIVNSVIKVLNKIIK